ncbi:hypothetical protein Tco_1471058 [Tanacetum coccineum]
MCDNLEIERLEQENDHLFKLLLSQDIVYICVNSLATLTNYAQIEQDYIDEYSENLMLKAELVKKEHMVEKDFFDEVILRCSRLENRGANLELKLQHQKESFLNNISFNNQNAPAILNFKKINEWQAKLDTKDVSIANLRKHIQSLKGKNVVEKVATPNNAKVITLEMFKLDLEPLAPRVLNNKDAHIDYIKHSREHADTLRKIVVLVYVKDACPCLTKPSEKLVAATPLNKNKKVRMKSSTSASRSPPSGNTKNYRISQIPSSNLKNKVEDHPRSVKSNSNKKNRVIEPVCNENVKDTMLSKLFFGMDSGCSKHMTGNRYQLINFVSKFLGTVRFGNDQIAKRMGYGDYQLGNVTILWVYYVEGIGRNLFSVGQFCDSDLEVAFQKHTCYVQNLDSADLLSGSRDTNLYTISLDDMLRSSPICLLSKALKTKSWL